MPYGTIKVDNITFDNGGTDKLLTVSGLFFSTSGALTVTGTISGGNVTAPTATFTTLTGITTAGTTATFTSGSFTSLTGVTATVTSGIFGLGSAAAPSIAFSGDTNTGLYSPGADTLAFVEGGVEAMRIDSSGRVGIGTTAPQSQLQVLDQIKVSNSAQSEGSIVLGDGASAAFNVGIARWNGTTNAAGAGGIGYFSQGTGNIGGHYFYTGDAAAGSQTARLVVNPSGNVGIGTTVLPGNKVTVGTGNATADSSIVKFNTANANVTALTLSNWDNTSTIYGPRIGFDNSGRGAFVIGGSDAANNFDICRTWGTPDLRINSSGNVGIGTSAPGVKLEVRGSLSVGENYIDTLNTDHSITLRNTGAVNNNNYTVRMQAAAGGGPEPSDSSLAFLTQTWNGSAYVLTEKMRIDSSGRLLVGTSSVTAVTDGNINPRLEVEGTDGSTGAIAVIRNSADANGAGFVIAKSRGTAAGSNTSVISSDTIGEIRFEGADGTQKQIAASISAVVDGTPGANDMPGRLVFSTTADGAASPTERMRITSTGKTWLSSTDSSYGQFQIGNTTSEGECSLLFIPGVTAFGASPTSTNGDSRIWAMGPNAYSVGATQFAIGNKGVGTYVAKLASNTATSWTFSSDERLKNIEGPVIAATQIIEAINPVYYSFKADSAATRKVGLIAQNVLSVLPEVVDVPEEEQDAEGNQHYMGLAMTDLVPVLIAALKESNLKIKELTDRVAALEGA